MRGLLEEYQLLVASGPVGRAVVTRVWGSAPRAEGACLLASLDGRMAGSVSGGCVETAAAEEIRAVMASGIAKKAGWGVSHERAWEMGLSCGGTIEVFVEPAVRPELIEAARSPGNAVLATVIAGPGPIGAAVLVEPGGRSRTLGQIPEVTAQRIGGAATAALTRLQSSVETIPTDDGELELFLEVFPRRPALLIFGGVHIAMALARLAGPLGYRTVVADGREGFLTRERFPDAELMLGWPDDVFARMGVDSNTSVCILTHDPKFDEPALELALRSGACYVGAIGSRRTQADRRERLRGLGFAEADIARLRGPIGLDLGGRAPEEIALSIMAEITATRYGRPIVKGA